MRVRLHGITWDHPRGYAGLLAATAAYARLRPDVEVRWDRQPLAAFESRPIGELAAGYDLLILDHPFAGDAAAQECLLDLTPYEPWLGLAGLAADTVGPSFASYSYGGGLWALPLDASCQTAAWRPDRLGSGPPPATLDEVFHLARGQRLAMALHGVHALMTLFTLCANLGTPPDGSPAGTVAPGPLLPRAAGTAALEALRELAGRCVPESRSWSPIAALEALSRRDDLAYAPYVFAYATYALPEHSERRSAGEPPPSERSEGIRRLRFGRIPGVAGPSGEGSVLGGTGLALSRRQRDPSPALSFAGYLTSAAVQASMALHGGQPARRSAWQDATVDGACRGFYADTLPTIERAYLRPRHPGMSHLQQAAGAALGDWLDGARPAREALETINRLFERHAPRPT